jgi:hypothetical protein
VTVPADTPAGRAIEATDGDGNVDPMGTFRNYVKLRIYLAAQRNLRTAEQRLSDGTVTEADCHASNRRSRPSGTPSTGSH